jgi:hypothetical protein
MAYDPKLTVTSKNLFNSTVSSKLGLTGPMINQPKIIARKDDTQKPNQKVGSFFGDGLKSD